ncbi:UDP-N-acetylglucosamine 2-epimerase [Halorussus litoreus]|uniref:UDP-N-acetylglucosamine 2-epimerase n=1 Tax=Halorussus litoreus TaxID=1710536 RepID=UPI000E22CA83|nr:UDP-N-acetylglucosamine 2-epimerase [Halorussus litoreus]
MTRTITVVTGTRAEYGLLKSSMTEIRRRSELQLTVVATGMHLSRQHGSTVEEIRSDGFDVTSTVDTLLESDTGVGMAKSLGLGISGLAETLTDIDPDVVLVLGDRNEAFAAGVAAAHLQIPVAHVHGGDAMQGATIDDSIRHALTKFAHLHFPATERSKERLLGLGEEEWRVTTVGTPGVDDVVAGEYDDASVLRAELGFDAERPLLLVVQHPVTTRPRRAGEQMRRTLDAVTDFDGQITVIYPNTDAGGKRIIEAIRSHPESEQLTTYDNLPRRQYLGLLDAADVMIGNSSSAIIEAPSFGLPVVDVGPRQTGRERAANATSVPHETDAIRNAVDAALHDDRVERRARTCDNPYDRGGAGERIADRLATVPLDDDLLTKRITY